MFLRIDCLLAEKADYLESLLKQLRWCSLHLSTDLILVVHFNNLKLASLVDVKVLGDGVNTFVGDLMVMNEPIEIVVIGGSDVICHDLFKPLIVGDDKQVYHDDIADMLFVD